MNQKNLKDIFSDIKNERRGGAPHGVWVERNRDILLMQVRNTVGSVEKPGLAAAMRHLFAVFVPMETVRMTARGLAVFALAIGTVLGGGIVSAQVYRDASPGEMLYRVKVAVERAQLALAPNDEYRTRLHTEFADRRIDEVAKLAEASTDRQDLVVEILAAFEAEVVSLQTGLESMRTNDPSAAIESAKLLERKTAVYQNVLRKASALLPSTLQPSITRTRDLVDGVTIKAMAVIVEHHLAGDSEASKSVVVTKFEERLQLAEDKLDSATKAQSATAPAAKTVQAKAAIAAAKVLVEEENYEAALSKIVEAAELTKEVEQQNAEAETVPTTETGPADGTSTTETAPAVYGASTDSSTGTTTETPKEPPKEPAPTSPPPAP